MRFDADIETEAYSRYALCLSDLGDDEGAEDYYGFLMKWNPDDAETALDYGTLLLRQSRLEEATVELHAAINLQNSRMSAEAYQQLAFIEELQGRLLTAYHCAVSAIDCTIKAEWFPKQKEFIQNIKKEAGRLKEKGYDLPAYTADYLILDDRADGPVF